ncbi:SRPBCC family protein [Endozoicomonas arenosclerae]|uniref:SRPBCC family protein n=1 Tax=Endozoicomonas arenosclerae TaxID=1633495 RepID=UPI000785E12F|nr:SRPBCC family protein [Endozoicomonas arenosclerae]
MNKKYLAAGLTLTVFAGLSLWPADNPRMAVSSTQVIDLPVEQSWEKMSNLAVSHHYVPDVIDTRMLTDQTQGVGASRRVFKSEDQYVDETVVEWNEGKGFVIKLHNETFFLPFKEGRFRYQITDVGSQQTEFTGTMSFEPPMGLLGDWLFRNVMAAPISKTVEQTVLGLRYYYETGQPVSDEVREAL